MRLARGSGVDGLAAMVKGRIRSASSSGRSAADAREELRAWLRAEGLDWAEDPSNADPAVRTGQRLRGP